MSRVLILGHGPLPFENESKLFGPGIRTWQFAKPLIDDGHEVLIICSRIPFVYAMGKPPVTKVRKERFSFYSVAQAVFEDEAFIQDVHDTFDPDCVVAATIFPSYVAAKIRTDRPFWADVFGDTMAEAQAKASTYSDDAYLSHFWRYMTSVLDRADIFSSVSEPQKYALIGQLGLRGRLSKRTIGYEFVHPIPCAVEVEEYKHQKRVLRGRRVADDDFVVLWSGGYNTWTDVDTLFHGLEMAMAENCRVKFASTGGQIDGHDEITYPRLLKMISASPYKDRFIMLGWVPTDEVPSYYFESNVGINIDAQNYEAVLGSRNRILQWMSAGLPVLTTETSEVTRVLRSKELGYTFEHGNPNSLKNAILSLASEPLKAQEYAERARRFVHEHWTFEATTEPLRHWVRNPLPAPDRGAGVLQEFLATPISPVPSIELPSKPPDSQIECLSIEAPTEPQFSTIALVKNVARSGSLALMLFSANSIARILYRYQARNAKRRGQLRAYFRADDTPPVLVVGQSLQVCLRIQNRTDKAWYSGRAATNSINLSYHWSNLLNRSVVFDGLRTSLPDLVPPGKEVQVRAHLQAPSRPGLYVLHWDVVQEGVMWFALKGSPALRLAVLVTNG